MKHKRIAILLVMSFLLSLFTVVVVTINIFAQEETWVEMVSERTRNGKKFQGQIDPNRFALDLSIGAIHYDSPDWKEINNTLVPSTANVPQFGLADWEMTQDDYEWFALETLNTVPMWLFRNRSAPDSYITFNPQAALQWTNDLDQISQIATIISDTIGQVSGNSIHWENAYGVGRNLTLFTNPNRMVKHLTLESYPGDPPAFIMDGENASLELRFVFDTPSGPNQLDIFVNGALWDRRDRVQTADEVEFRIGGETLFVFANPTYFDSNEITDVGTMVLTRQGGNVIVGVRVPLGFLQTAIYPVTIDPTLDLDIATSSDDAHQQEPGSMFLSGPYNLWDSDTEGSSRFWMGVRFVNSDISQGDTIDVAYISIRIRGTAYDDANGNLYFEDAASPSTFTTTANDISDRTLTTASVSWVQDGLGTGYKDSPSIVTPMQEMVDDFDPTAFVIIGIPNQDVDKILQFVDNAANPALDANFHVEYTAGAAATCEALTVVVTNPSGQLFFNGSTDDPTGGLWQEENVSEDFQAQMSTSAINVTNDDTAGACDVTLELLTSPGSGRTMKFNTTSTAPTPDFNNIPVGSNITIVNLASEATQAIWLWIDLDDSQGGQATPTLRVDTELP